MRVIKWKRFFCWEDDKEEKWLEEQAFNGLHFVSVNLFGRYAFETGEKMSVRYCLDYKTKRKDLDEYITMFNDAGWEYLGHLKKWQYFRREYDPSEDINIYTDAESKILNLKRVTFEHAIMLLVIFFSVIFFLMFKDGLNTEVTAFISGFFTGFTIPFVITIALMLYRLNKRMLELKPIE